MKALPALLAASLVANAALAVLALRDPANTPASASSHSEYGEPAYSAPEVSAPPAPDAPPPETWERLRSSDLPTFVANLRAAGLPERMVRILINAEINDRFRAREEAARPKRPKRDYWEQGSSYYTDPTTLEQRLAQLDLRREKEALRRQLLGEPPRDADDDHPIPAEKRDLIRQVSEDYDTMISQIQRETRGMPLASDEEQIRFLREEKEAELKSLLTPAELHEHELRSSRTASQLRSELAAFHPTEQEYRDLFSLRKELDDAFPPPTGEVEGDYWQRRNEAQKAIDARIAEYLGPERYRDYTRSKDHEYRSLATLVTRLDLPQETATRVYDLRYSVPTDALQIVRNENLTPAAKQDQLKVIAQETRERLANELGAEAAEAYLRRHGQWIKSLERGQVIEYKPDGSRQNHSISR